MHKRIATTVAAGALVLGAAGASFLIPSLAAAADPTASPAASPSATSSTGSGSSSSSPSTSTTTSGDCANGNHGRPGGLDADDLTAAAGALGVTEAELTTDLQSGQSAADVATAQGVNVQNVIDAVVASDKAEIQAAVDAGTITQAQADLQLANLTTHVTDEVNGVAPQGGPGHRRPNSGDSPAASPSTTNTTSTGTTS